MGPGLHGDDGSIAHTGLCDNDDEHTETTCQEFRCASHANLLRTHHTPRTCVCNALLVSDGGKGKSVYIHIFCSKIHVPHLTLRLVCVNFLSSPAGLLSFSEGKPASSSIPAERVTRRSPSILFLDLYYHMSAVPPGAATCWWMRHTQACSAPRARCSNAAPCTHSSRPSRGFISGSSPSGNCSF